MKTKFEDTEIGRIPEDWDVKELKEICLKEKGSIISGPFGSNIGSKYFVDEGIPVIRGNNLTTDFTKFVDDGFVFITENKANDLKTWALEDDLVFTAAGTLGQIGIIPKKRKYDKYIISNKQLRARINKQIMDINFAFYWIQSKRMIKYINLRNTGSTIPLINLSILKTLPFPFPPLPEQHAIAKILSDFDSKIELLQKQNKTLEAIGQAIFKHWFVDFEFPNEEGKPYKSSGGEMVFNEELGKEIPKGWKVDKLSEILVELESGIRPEGGIKECDDGVPSIGAENILGLGKYDYSKTKYIPRSFFKAMKKGIIKSGDVLLYKDGAQLGRKSMFTCNFPFRECCINELIFTPFLFPFLRSYLTR